MNLTLKYVEKEEYERDWEPRYQALEDKYYKEDGTAVGDTTDYDSDLERLDYQYAKLISERIHQRLKDTSLDCQSALDENDYTRFDKHWDTMNQLWKDLNTPFHYKMSARTILERD